MLPLLRSGELTEVERVVEDDLKDQETLVLKARGERISNMVMVMWMRSYLVLPLLKTEAMVRMSQMERSQEGWQGSS